MLTRAIRRLSFALIIVAVIAAVDAIRGNYVVENSPNRWEWPGLAEELLLLGLLGLGVVLYATIQLVWLVAALRRAEWGWVIAAIAVTVGSLVLSVTVYTHGDFFLGAIAPLTQSSTFLDLLAVFVPLLAGIAPATIYSYLAEADAIRRGGSEAATGPV
jgi:hypothetical protein